MSEVKTHPLHLTTSGVALYQARLPDPQTAPLCWRGWETDGRPKTAPNEPAKVLATGQVEFVMPAW
ncbi:hypothetical protein LAY57_01220 [Argonema antarcticum A004/B2]|uniref:hypothetical protein n=1 Tax=Argonema antarcticum TaxID=2942763 RepID=UPI0030D9A084|nr:hypothetical protein [Argonema antarcticum A004/B2]